MKRIIAIGDLHCGHIAGLTPPKWQLRDKKLGGIQSEMWKEYRSFVKKYKNLDVVIVNGDAIEGKGSKSGGTENITNDLLEQVQIAFECLKIWDTKRFYFTYGTSYHVAPNGEDMELLLAEKFNTKIKSELNLSVNGVVINAKHHVSSSAIPWSRSTGAGRDRIQNYLWSEKDSCPKADIILRSHVHYYATQGGVLNKPWLSMTLPALQAAHTKYGARRCSATVDWGVVLFEINNGSFAYTADIINLTSIKRELITI